jgi:hypothetical protein
LKVSIYIFVVSTLAIGSLVAQENVALAWRTSAAAEDVTITEQTQETILQTSSSSERGVTSIRSREQSAVPSDPAKTSNCVAPTFNFDYGNDQVSARAIDERIIDRLGLFDRPDDGGSSRCSVSLDLENEDSDWSFEVTFTVEF